MTIICNISKIFNLNCLANTGIQQEGGSGGDDSPSSHDSGLGGNITGMVIGNTNVNCEAVDVANCNVRTDSATPPPSNSNNEMDIVSRGMETNIEETQENFKHIQGQRMNTSSPLSCPSSPISVSTGRIHSTPSPFNNSVAASSSSRSLATQNNNASQTLHISEWPTNVAGVYQQRSARPRGVRSNN